MKGRLLHSGKVIEMTKREKLILQAYLQNQNNFLLNHQFEMEEDYIAGLVDRFLKGERFNQKVVAFTNEQIKVINSAISMNIESENGKDLLTDFLLTKIVCNILNKYQKTK